MALSIRNVCLHRNFNLLKNKNVVILTSQNSKRYLRGSRYGRDLNRTETRFQELLKSLKEKSAVNTTEAPATVVKSVADKETQIEDSKKNPADDSDAESNLPVPPDDIYHRLEMKITPLRKHSYNRQLEKKYSKCLGLLRNFGEKLRVLKMPLSLGPDKLPCPVDLVVPSPLTEGYRNHDEFSVGVGTDGNPKTVGFYLNNKTDDSVVCVEPDELIIIKDNHKKFAKDFQNYIRNSPLPATSKVDDGGYWKSVSMRSNVEGEMMGIITMNRQELSQAQLQLEQESLNEHFRSSGQDYNLSSLYFETCSSESSKKTAFYQKVFGDTPFIEKLNKLELQISPGSFFPSNTYIAESMYNALRKLCRVSDSTSVIDISCGVGSTSLSFAPFAKRCIGLDECSQSIIDAKTNIEINKRYNTEFICGTPGVVLRDVINRDYHEDLLAIINPSKTELSVTAIRFLRDCKFLNKIIYISTKPTVDMANFIRLCRPAAGQAFLGKYFVPIMALPVDLFPQTEHFGLIMMFQRV